MTEDEGLRAGDDPSIVDGRQRTMFAPPAVGELRSAVERVLDGRGHREHAARLAAAIDALPPVAEAAGVLTQEVTDPGG